MSVRSVLAKAWLYGKRAVAIFILASILLTAIYETLPPPATPLMAIRLIEGEGLAKDWVPIEEISPHLIRAVIAAEDGKFCQHAGFDWESIGAAWKRNSQGKRLKGGSTISNQTAKNVFLWPQRSYPRKALEFYFTGLIELAWSKRRIMEVYLNVIEFGPGIYGAEAASQNFFGRSAAELSPRQAALLAAILPNPRKYSAAKPSGYVSGRAATILRRMNDIPCRIEENRDLIPIPPAE